MKIAGLETFLVGNPPPHRGGRYFLFLKLRTACGVEGVGEVYCASFGPRAVLALIEDLFGRVFEGEDPHRIERMFRRAYGAGYHGRPDPTLMSVFSGLEMACWDIVGKAAGRSVADLLGGRVRERARTYTYIYPPQGSAHPTDGLPSVYDDPDLAAEEAARLVAAGHTALKFDPCGPYTVHDGHMPGLADLARTEAFCARLRAAVGDRADLLVGTHGQFTAAGAVRMARRIEAADPLWFEEPTPADAPLEMAKVARAVRTPIAAGERLTTKWEFAALLEAGAAAILQPNLARVGGVLEAKKIAGMAEARHVQIAPHLYNGPIAAAANLQFALTLPNFLILEGVADWTGFHADLLRTPFDWADGSVAPPDAPGLGVELDEAVARAHPYEADALHLAPAGDPIF